MKHYNLNREGFFVAFVFCSLELMVFCSGSYALDVTLGWDANRDVGIEGYYIYCKQGSGGDPGLPGTYDTVIKVPIDDPFDPNSLDEPDKPVFTVKDLDETKSYHFAVAAYAKEGYSKGSREVFVLGSEAIPVGYQKAYDRGWGITTGDLRGFTVLFSSVEKVLPTLDSSLDIPALSLNGLEPAGPLLSLSVEPSLKPGFAFAVPVALLIPVPDNFDATRLSVGLYETRWTLVWDGEVDSQKGGWDWLAAKPLYRVISPFDPSGPSVVELVVRHFSGVQLAQSPAVGYSGGKGGGGGGCFIFTLIKE
jgi:hypothetical protein